MMIPLNLGLSVGQAIYLYYQSGKQYLFKKDSVTYNMACY